MYRYAVVYELAESGRNWSAYVPDLPGCITVGDTLEDCQRHIQEAIALHLQGMREDGEAIPEPTTQVDYAVVA